MSFTVVGLTGVPGTPVKGDGGSEADGLGVTSVLTTVVSGRLWDLPWGDGSLVRTEEVRRAVLYGSELRSVDGV